MQGYILGWLGPNPRSSGRGRRLRCARQGWALRWGWRWVQWGGLQTPVGFLGWRWGLWRRWMRRLWRIIMVNRETESASSQSSYVPRGLLLQWHVTERCNLRCAHCYQDEYAGSELNFQQLLEVLSQFTGLLKSWRNSGGRIVRGHVTVTGGEPFVRRGPAFHRLR